MLVSNMLQVPCFAVSCVIENIMCVFSFEMGGTWPSRGIADGA